MLELQRLGLIEEGEAPATPPTRRPQVDDDALGLQFFRTLVADVDLSKLTMPGTFFGRSEIARCSFRDSDLRMSTMCWNDFVQVDFSDACLADCDLRGSTFEGCRFANANLTRALLGHDQSLDLSNAQRASVMWSDEEPPGG
jgi:uncharacterized protein YjbI with pentapeptide repeats